MTIFTDGKYYLQEDLKKYSKVTLYGLHYKVNICNLVSRNMIVAAINYNNTHLLLSNSEIIALESALVRPYTCKSCKS